VDYPYAEEEWYEDEYADYEVAYQAAAFDFSGGCLMGFLPLAAVIFVSCLLAFLAFNWTSPAIAISITRTDEQAQPSDSPELPVQQLDSQPAADRNRLAPLFAPSIHYWEDLILSIASQYDLDPNLVATVMQIESCGDPQAVSSAGARGLFQVMPYHFSTGEDPFDPQTNATRGMAYLDQALDARQGDARLAMASYNGGITGASRPESQWAAETQRYAYWGEGIYQDASQGKKKSKRLDEWLNAGGAGLCTQAASRLGINP
jgi:soluble lytic murein transglycosylase-like protein